jgi:tetraacyldisaccharide 4'-kinase
MNLANLTLQSFRIVLLPVSILYGIIIHIRNILFDKQWLKSASFNIPVICVGNLSVGGTGKSPLIELLIKHLIKKYKPAVLSRGYKRKTKGYVLANEKSTALDIGDEPMQFCQKYPNLTVAVSESRVVGVPHLLQDKPETDVILLDDAFQHRSIQPGLSLLLTDYSDLFTRDFFLPTGNLRDEKKSYKRADIILVTKCEADLTTTKKEAVIKEINPLPHQHIFFTSLHYAIPYHIINHETKKEFNLKTDVLLVTGIANIRPIKKILNEHSNSYEQMTFSDHHIYTLDDLKEIEKRFNKMKGSDSMILTTEKDAVRLIKFKDQLAKLPVYVLPVQHQILFNEESVFLEKITGFIDTFKEKSAINRTA